MRLKMKNLLEYYKKRNNAFSIFTTHFLKDVELFCDKIGIMSFGEMNCIMTTEQMKLKLGGYTSVMTFWDINNVNNCLSQLTKYATVRVTNQNPDAKKITVMLTNISDIFGLIQFMLSIKNENILQEFSLNQISIEDIFIDLFQ